MAEPQKRGKRYRARVVVGKRENGTLIMASETFPTKAAARDWISVKQSEVSRGIYVAPSTVTVAEFGNLWLAGAAKTRLRPRTLAQYEGLLKRHVYPTLGSTSVARVNLAAIDTLYARLSGKGLGARSIRYVHATLRTMLTSAVRAGILLSNPTVHATLPRIPHSESAYLTPEQVHALLDAAASDPWYPYWLMLAHTGMRPSEALGLKWSDWGAGKVSIRRTVVTLGKTWQFEDCKTKRSRRTITIPASVVDALKAHRKVIAAERLLRGARWQDHDLIFPSETGAPPDMRSLVRLHFDPYRKAAKLPKVSPYALRHSHISALLSAGVPVAAVSARVGHSSPVMTLGVYAHVTDGGGDQIAGVVERLSARGH